MQNESQIAYLRVWKWGLIVEVLGLTVLGFLMFIWCGIASLIAGAASSFLLYREITRPGKTKHLMLLIPALSLVEALAFAMPSIAMVLWKNQFTSSQSASVVRAVMENGGKLFLAILIWMILDKILIFTISYVIRKILQMRLQNHPPQIQGIG